jgi:hypothetical protein
VELAVGRLLPWLAVAYGFGIVLYFTAERAPRWSAATADSSADVTALASSRSQPGDAMPRPEDVEAD